VIRLCQNIWKCIHLNKDLLSGALHVLETKEYMLLL
jgi:hypothetical protein